MLKRKNNDISYVPAHMNQSPYRFERKNPNLSPGLSPIRCRTPTRAHLSPFRATTSNNNNRGHSPIKFMTSKVTNPTTRGFYRTQTTQNQYAQKYATLSNNNDHSIKRQAYYENPNNSKINYPQENSQRTTLHQNNKLFSKLVQKLNSEKKKQPELVKRNTKPQMFRPHQFSHTVQNQAGIQKLTKKKSQQENPKPSPFIQHIKPVQSVVYEQKQKKTYFDHQQATYNYAKQNQQQFHENTYKFKQIEKYQAVGAETAAKNINLKAQKMEEKNHSGKKVQKSTIPSKQQEIQKEKNILGRKVEETYHVAYNSHHQPYDPKGTNQLKSEKYPNLNDSTSFDDIQMYLDKLNYVQNSNQKNISERFINTPEPIDVSASILTMDPFI